MHEQQDARRLHQAVMRAGFDGNAYERVSQVKKLDILDVEILNLQKNLNILGYNTGKPDAVLGNKSKQAIRKIQRELGAPADGIPSEEQRYHIQDLADQKREEFAKLNRNQLGQRREATRIDDDKSAKAPSADAAVQGANLSCGGGITFSAKYQKAGSLDVLRLSQNGKSVSNLRKTATAPDFSERYEFGNNYAHFDGDAVELALNGETYFCEVGPNSANQDANAETTPKL